jgi:hypothetical protein
MIVCFTNPDYSTPLSPAPFKESRQQLYWFALAHNELLMVKFPFAIKTIQETIN